MHQVLSERKASKKITIIVQVQDNVTDMQTFLIVPLQIMHSGNDESVGESPDTFHGVASGACAEEEAAA